MSSLPSPIEPSELHSDEAEALAACLAAGERVQTIVRPTRVGRSLALTGAYTVAAVSLVASVGLFAAGAASAPLVTTLLAVLSVLLVGVADRRARRVAAYAVTDRRLMVLTDGATGVRVEAVPKAALARRRLDVRAGGGGRIRLLGAARVVTVGPVADVRAVNALLDALPGAAPSAADRLQASSLPSSELPSAEAFRDADVDRIARALEPGERVLWMGQPEPTWGMKQTLNGVQQRAATALWPMFVAMGAIAGLAFVGLNPSDAVRMIVPLLQFVAAAYGIWLTRQLRRRSLYVVTDRRALVGLPGLRSYTVQSFEGDALSGATTTVGTGGRRSVIFAGARGDAATEPGYRGGRIRRMELAGPSGSGFEFIRDAEAVAALVRRVAGGEAPGGDLLARRLPQRAATSVDVEDASRAAHEIDLAARTAPSIPMSQPIGLPGDALAGLDEVEALAPQTSEEIARIARPTRA